MPVSSADLVLLTLCLDQYQTDITCDKCLSLSVSVYIYVQVSKYSARAACRHVLIRKSNNAALKELHTTDSKQSWSVLDAAVINRRLILPFSRYRTKKTLSADAADCLRWFIWFYPSTCITHWWSVVMATAAVARFAQVFAHSRAILEAGRWSVI